MLGELKRIMLIKDLKKEDLYDHMPDHEIEELFDPTEVISTDLIEKVADLLNINVKITFNL